jgi:hypothetical protein
MHPRREMNALAQAKIRLRARIATRRAACRDAVTTLSAPLEWIDLAVACARRVAAVQGANWRGRGTSSSGPGFARIARWLDAIDVGLRTARLVRNEADWWIAITLC